MAIRKVKQHPTTIQTWTGYVEDPARERACYFLCNLEPELSISVHRSIYAKFAAIPADNENHADERLTLRHNSRLALRAVMTSRADDDADRMILNYLKEHRSHVTDPVLAEQLEHIIGTTKPRGDSPVFTMRPCDAFEHQGVA